jgi:hypothetical protein
MRLFTPGPVSVHPEVLAELASPSMFHRCDDFMALYTETECGDARDPEERCGLPPSRRRGADLRKADPQKVVPLLLLWRARTQVAL